MIEKETCEGCEYNQDNQWCVYWSHLIVDETSCQEYDEVVL